MTTWRVVFLLPVLLTGSCARDVVLKPAVIAFNGRARESVAAVRAHYDATIVRLNHQTADFIAANPDCGLATMIVPRRLNPAAPRTGGFCLSEAEKAALPDNARVVSRKLQIASRNTFAAQFAAAELLIDYVTFLAKYADDPRATAKAEITATASALVSLGSGISAIRVAAGGDEIKEFAPGGAVEKFGAAIGDIAEQVELIANQADDVRALETQIHASAGPVDKAIDELVKNADLWTCAALERQQKSANDYAEIWTPRLGALEIEARRDVANTWLGLVQDPPPGFCPGGSGAGDHGEVGTILVGIKAANTDLVRLADHKYTPAERKAIADATLTRLGVLLTRLAAAAPLLP